jgi:hypothetical protein
MWYALSVYLGHTVTSQASNRIQIHFAKLVREHDEYRDDPTAKDHREKAKHNPRYVPDRVPAVPKLMGHLERAAFTWASYAVVSIAKPPDRAGVASTLASSLGTAAVGWIGLKIAVGWQKGASPQSGYPLALARSQGFAGLIGSVVSLGFAFLAGYLMTTC